MRAAMLWPPPPPPPPDPAAALPLPAAATSIRSLLGTGLTISFTADVSYSFHKRTVCQSCNRREQSINPHRQRKRGGFGSLTAYPGVRRQAGRAAGPGLLFEWAGSNLGRGMAGRDHGCAFRSPQLHQPPEAICSWRGVSLLGGEMSLSPPPPLITTRATPRRAGNGPGGVQWFRHHEVGMRVQRGRGHHGKAETRRSCGSRALAGGSREHHVAAIG
ncbi:hypothetical protein B0J12DRAFT_303124 [Macrophomina phaseolina]|uniref:Uncharacterized protein n=1 Tax=Macrophomina phaseolina TaxID=35725 RepID=A0ABQ8FXB0_9PEZI|nr:hypothetical protein B0J12DRAFT_303124 [Macrophomina phaseolina]